MHFNSDGHRGLEEMEIQLIDHVKGEKELRERENQWIYKLATLAPHGLNDARVSLVTQCLNVQFEYCNANLVTVFSHPEEEYSMYSKYRC